MTMINAMAGLPHGDGKVVIRGGENISPRETEDFLYTHPTVWEAAVFGVPDKFYEERRIAWIMLHEGSTATEEEFIHYYSDKIAHYKIPQKIRFVKEFPMTITDKIQKFRMRELK